MGSLDRSAASSFVYARASGLLSKAFVGANATVIQGVKVGADSIIGAGSIVLRDVPDGETYVSKTGAFGISTRFKE